MKSPKPRNEHAAALHNHAANAGVAVAVDTRPKSIPNKKKKSDRKKVKAKLNQLQE